MSFNLEDVATNEEKDLNDSDDEALPTTHERYQKLLASSDVVQNFIFKATNIIIQFLGDSTAPKELLRSVLKFTKIAITYLDFTKEENHLSLILKQVFGLANPRDYSSVVRRIVTKLIVRVGVDKVRTHTLKEH